jgi:hypothetical protein
LNRCESSLASEQSIEQKSLQREVHQLTIKNIKPLTRMTRATAQQNEQINSAFLPVHIPLVLLVQLNQIIFL